jgi:hypothetical protein
VIALILMTRQYQAGEYKIRPYRELKIQRCQEGALESGRPGEGIAAHLFGQCLQLFATVGLQEKTLHSGEGATGDKERFFYHDGGENGNAFQSLPVQGEAKSAGDNDLCNALRRDAGTGQEGVDSGPHRSFGELESADIRLGDENFAARIAIKAKGMSISFGTQIAGEIRFDLVNGDNPAAGIDETVLDGNSDQGKEAAAGEAGGGAITDDR